MLKFSSPSKIVKIIIYLFCFFAANTFILYGDIGVAILYGLINRDIYHPDSLFFFFSNDLFVLISFFFIAHPHNFFPVGVFFFFTKISNNAISNLRTRV